MTSLTSWWTGWMTAVLGLVLGAAAIAVIPAERFFHRPAPAAAGEGGRWACPMMDFIGTRAGTCPVCGMDLGLVTAGELSREQRRRMGVEVATISEGPATATIHAAGSADFDHRSTRIVIPRIAGRILQRHPATFGCCQEVAEGEAIIDIYSPEAYQAQVELKAAIDLGDARLVQSLMDRFARWNLTPVAEAIRAGGAPTDTVTITAPFGGQAQLAASMMADETLMVGKLISADTPLLRLVHPDLLTLIIHVPEHQARFLAEGQPVEITSDDGGPLPGLAATVARVAIEINPETRTVEVRVHLRGARNVLRPGSLVMARIRAALGPDLKPADPGSPSTWGSFPLIPASAVLSTGVRHVAWKLESTGADGRQTFVPVSLALGQRLEDAEGRDQFVVRAGLKAGDQVAVQGAFLIDSQAQLAGTPSLLFPTGAAAAPGHSHAP